MVQIHSSLLSFFSPNLYRYFFSHGSVKKNPSERFWEIDFLRGIAIFLMIVYHLVFDLNYYELYRTNLNSLPVLLFLYPISTSFLLLVGISLTLSNSRARSTLSTQQMRGKFLKRGGGVFGLGLLITVVTWIYPHDGYIVFGVLHCIGLSIILAYPLVRFRTPTLALGILCIIIGVFLQTTVTVDFPWLLWLGLIPSHFSTLDYFPLLPWFGVVLIGVFLGNSLYQNNKRKFSLKDHSQFIISRGVCFLGRHSLIIYLLHQLIIVCLLYFIHLVVNGSRIV
ncbi:MAG: DUF1624 domain-containing protein [Thermoplasmata archaeon]|nr:DUF1624 domain-containing protein [Thermoplasmata archaeon]MBE3139242.1 DUF1624 domain-containing protein [Thermoplasmata archaeon]